MYDFPSLSHDAQAIDINFYECIKNWPLINVGVKEMDEREIGKEVMGDDKLAADRA